MAQYYKPRENIVNDKIFDYFYLNNFNNYEVIYLINDKDYSKLKDINSLEPIEVSPKGLVNDKNPVYLNLNRLTPAKSIYLKEYQELLDDDNIKSFFQTFKGIIITNDKLIPYLRDLSILHENFIINKNTYLIIDRYGKAEEVAL